jgi:hypothetical protein
VTHMKLKPFVADGVLHGYSFFCPGCDHGHIFYVAGSLVWTFNNDLELPTFSPSLLNTCENHPDPKQRRCHLVLTAGKLNYMGDCSHDLAGKEIDLPDRWPDP